VIRSATGAAFRMPLLNVADAGALRCRHEWHCGRCTHARGAGGARRR
jgi:hypothetical protein